MNKKVLFLFLLLGLAFLPGKVFAKEMTTIKSFGLPMVTDFSGDTTASLKSFGIKVLTKQISLGNDSSSEFNVVDETSLLRKLPKFVRIKRSNSDTKNKTFYLFYDDGELVFDKFKLPNDSEYKYQVLIKKNFTNILLSSPATDYYSAAYFYSVSFTDYDEPHLTSFITSENRNDYARITEFYAKDVEDPTNIQSTEVIKNSSGGVISDANIKADIQATYDENFVPENLGELVAAIPGFLRDFAAAFSLVGLLFTSLLGSFPPFVVVGLYSVFGMGVLILLFKILL